MIHVSVEFAALWPHHTPLFPFLHPFSIILHFPSPASSVGGCHGNDAWTTILSCVVAPQWHEPLLTRSYVDTRNGSWTQTSNSKTRSGVFRKQALCFLSISIHFCWKRADYWVWISFLVLPWKLAKCGKYQWEVVWHQHLIVCLASVASGHLCQISWEHLTLWKWQLLCPL